MGHGVYVVTSQKKEAVIINITCFLEACYSLAVYGHRQGKVEMV